MCNLPSGFLYGKKSDQTHFPGIAHLAVPTGNH